MLVIIFENGAAPDGDAGLAILAVICVICGFLIVGLKRLAEFLYMNYETVLMWTRIIVIIVLPLVTYFVLRKVSSKALYETRTMRICATVEVALLGILAYYSYVMDISYIYPFIVVVLFVFSIICGLSLKNEREATQKLFHSARIINALVLYLLSCLTAMLYYSDTTAWFLFCMIIFFPLITTDLPLLISKIPYAICKKKYNIL